MLPILFAVAVLRYRLYDIDVIINRAVVIVAATAFAAVCYTTLVVLVGNQVNTRAGGFWLSLLGIATVALAFQPLRHAVIRLSDRLAYGVRAKPYEALSSFSRRLAETPSPSTLLPAVAEAAGRAVSARGATVTLDSPGHGAAVATTWGDAPDGATVSHRLPMLYDGVALGAIIRAAPEGARSADTRPAAPGCPGRPDRGRRSQHLDGGAARRPRRPSWTGPRRSWPCPGRGSSPPTTRRDRRSSERSPVTCCPISRRCRR